MSGSLDERSATHDLEFQLRRVRRGRAADRVSEYGSDRICDHPGCATRLSIYNPDSRCAIHEAVPSRSRR